MYENKKEKSMTLIQRKDNRLEELKLLIQDEILPKLEKLRRDQQQYQEYQKVCRDIEYLTRIHISYKYVQYQKSVATSENNIKQLTNEIEKNKTTIAKNLEEIGEIDVRVTEIQEQLDTVSFGFTRS